MQQATVKAIETKLTGGRARFIAALEITTDRGTIEQRVSVSAQALLRYRVFLEELLLLGCGMYRHAGCEGRPEDAADESWRGFVACVLNAPDFSSETPDSPLN